MWHHLAIFGCCIALFSFENLTGFQVNLNVLKLHFPSADSPDVDQQAYSEILNVAAAEAQAKLETEQRDVEQYITDIVQVQVI